jgi:hypothetical protein
MVLSADEDVMPKADAALRTKGLSARLLGTYEVHRGEINLKMTLLELLPSPDALPNLDFDSADYPKRISFRRGSLDGKVISFSDSRVVPLLASGPGSTEKWALKLYGHSGGAIQTSQCLNHGDKCTSFASGDTRDHLFTGWVDVPRNCESAFFSIWIRPEDRTSFPGVFLQNERTERLGSAEELVERSNGWLLLGNSVSLGNAKHVRMVVMEAPGETLQLEKPFMVAYPTTVISSMPRSESIADGHERRH